MLPKQILMNCSSFETRVALLEGSSLVEFHVERAAERGIVGNIYKGRVVRVLPGMQSAFVDIGQERAAFLFAGDIVSPDRAADFIPDGDEDGPRMDGLLPNHHRGREQKISDLIHEGQEILVQVAKDAIGTKGARITTYLSLPGRYVVLMPSISHVGVSRRIRSEEARARLREIIMTHKPEGAGVIVRTASEDVPDDKLIADIQFLNQIWDSIRTQSAKSRGPSLIHEDLNLMFRASRDLLAQDVERIIIDDKTKYHELVHFLNRFSIRLGAQVQLYENDTPIFDAYGIELEVSRALQPKVWLKSGGYIVIDQTEALTAIDVNTGRYTGNKSLDDTVFKTNLEAAKEIVLQLRLRNLGGIIIVDFIDMERHDDREKVFHLLQEELKRDKARTSVLKISELGLVQMTRKRTEESLAHKLCMPCPSCQGRGRLKSTTTMSFEIIRELERECRNVRHGTLVVTAHPDVSDRLFEEDQAFVDVLRNKFKKSIVIKGDSAMHPEHYEISPVS